MNKDVKRKLLQVVSRPRKILRSTAPSLKTGVKRKERNTQKQWGKEDNCCNKNVSLVVLARYLGKPPHHITPPPSLFHPSLVSFEMGFCFMISDVSLVQAYTYFCTPPAIISSAHFLNLGNVLNCMYCYYDYYLQNTFLLALVTVGMYNFYCNSLIFENKTTLLSVFELC